VLNNILDVFVATDIIVVELTLDNTIFITVKSQFITTYLELYLDDYTLSTNVYENKKLISSNISTAYNKYFPKNV
jgi:hypothetical protein